MSKGRVMEVNFLRPAGMSGRRLNVPFMVGGTVDMTDTLFVSSGAYAIQDRDCKEHLFSMPCLGCMKPTSRPCWNEGSMGRACANVAATVWTKDCLSLCSA